MRAQAGRQLLNAAATGCSLPLVFCFHGSSFWEKKEGSLSLPSQCGLHAILSFHFIRSLSTSHTSPPIPEKPRWPWPVCDYLIPFWSISSLSLSLSKYLSLPPLPSSASLLAFPVLPILPICLSLSSRGLATASDASACKRCHHLIPHPRRLLESLVARK